MNIAPYYISVDREAKMLTVKKWQPIKEEYKVVSTFNIAIGRLGYETPAGDYIVQAKSNRPDWTKPKSDWIPKEEWGQVVPFDDPANPIKGAFLKLTDDGVGIHGTSDLQSLGTAASHGCIRVKPEVAIHLFKVIPKNTLVVIK